MYRYTGLLLISFALIVGGCTTRGNMDLISTDQDQNVHKQYAEIETQPGFTQKIAIYSPQNPIAILIMLSGGNGVLNLIESNSRPIVTENEFNFVIRTRYSFTKAGFMVVLPDCPEPYKTSGGLTRPIRTGPPHRNAISKIIDWCKEKEDIPVWLIGMSNGTVSVARMGISLRDKVDGLVFTSSILGTKPSLRKYLNLKDGIIDMGLFMIDDPVMIAHHKNDACSECPASKIEKFRSALKNSPDVMVKLYSGGKPARSGPCKQMSAHGFYGIEQVVVKDIIEFIRPKVISKASGTT